MKRVRCRLSHICLAKLFFKVSVTLVLVGHQGLKQEVEGLELRSIADQENV